MNTNIRVRPDIDPPIRRWVSVGKIDGVPLHVCLVYSEPNLADNFLGGFEIVDFRAPGHFNITWEWVDKRMKEITAALPFGG